MEKSAEKGVIGDNPSESTENQKLEEKEAKTEPKWEHPQHYKVAPHADWHFRMPATYVDYYEKVYADLMKLNPEHDASLEFQVKRIAEHRTLHIIILDYETYESYTLADGDESKDEKIVETVEGDIRARKTVYTTRMRELYFKVKYYLGGNYSSLKHSSQIDYMVRDYTKRTEVGRRELGRIKAFVDETIRTMNKHLKILPGEYKNTIEKMKEEIAGLVDKVIR